MPFASALVPSIALGLLKGTLDRINISSKVCYPTVRFAEMIGFSLYKDISNGEFTSNSDLVGEWIFSGSLFEKTNNDIEKYINNILRKQSFVYNRNSFEKKGISEEFIQEILYIQGKIEDFLDECLFEILSYKPQIVGFTSVFQQHIPSLALAKRIKDKMPETRIILGGANCDNIMGIETIRQFSFIDSVVSGEGDIVFPELTQRILEEKSFSDIPGVFTRDNIDYVINKNYFNASRVENMNSLPLPHYNDFFEEIEKSNLELNDHFQPRLLFETSRGCWWGEVIHCTFCGLNANNMSYRSKSASQALRELNILINKFPGHSVSMVDNILDVKYFKDFLPELAARKLDLDIFYEIKANLKKDQVKILRDAGVTMLQPGIESFSSEVLKLMGKGIKGIYNIQLLKWCKEYGITPFWNILWGFPGEPEKEYEFMAHTIPILSHLHPPVSGGTIRLDRFSPNFTKSEQLGFTDLQPYPAYALIYKDLPQEVIYNLAYYFTFQYRRPQDVKSYTEPVIKQIDQWKKDYVRSDLFYRDKDTYLEIWDTRPIAGQTLSTISGLQRMIYIYCDEVRNLKQIRNFLQKGSDIYLSEKELEKILDSFIERQFMYKEGNLYLSLAIPVGDYSPRESIIQSLVWILTKEDMPAEDEGRELELTGVEDFF